MRHANPNEKIHSRAHRVLAEIGGETNGFEKVFSGKVLMREDNLDLPLKTNRPTVFALWNDLFHEGVSMAFIAKVYAVMMTARKHTYLVPTKRAKRMADVVNYLFYTDPGTELLCESLAELGWDDPTEWSDENPHIWHGVTAEDQKRADERISQLLRVPGNRFLSVEPLLGAIDLTRIDGDAAGPGSEYCMVDCLSGRHTDMGRPCADAPTIHAVLLGGESGSNARPMHPDWARALRDQCTAAGVPFYFKQWGEWCPATEEFGVSGSVMPETGEKFTWIGWDGTTQNPSSHGLGDPVMAIARMGKRRAGRLLDGQLHDDLPWGGAPC